MPGSSSKSPKKGSSKKGKAADKSNASDKSNTADLPTIGEMSITKNADVHELIPVVRDTLGDAVASFQSAMKKHDDQIIQFREDIRKMTATDSGDSREICLNSQEIHKLVGELGNAAFLLSYHGKRVIKDLDERLLVYNLGAIVMRVSHLVGIDLGWERLGVKAIQEWEDVPMLDKRHKETYQDRVRHMPPSFQYTFLQPRG